MQGQVTTDNKEENSKNRHKAELGLESTVMTST